MRLKELLFGRALRTEEEQVQQLGPATAIPTLGLDALGSASYGPEAAMTALLPLGVVAVDYIGWITAGILLILLAAFFSYFQTIAAYPHGGGSFTVAKENLGRWPGLLAASALSIDYVLNVAVAISAGVGALVSAAPSLLPHTLPICLGILALLTLINLRGLRTTGLLLMVPAYLFLASMGAIIVVGLVKTCLAHGHPHPITPPPRMPAALTVAPIWLLLRAFANGCAALTGVEAVSNAVPVFRQPTVKGARRTLVFLVALLSFLLCGVAFLSFAYHVTATAPGQKGYQSLISQITAAVVGRGIFYHITLASVLLVLLLSANTSFADFPRVCRVLALDEYLPAEFAHRGSRLVYTAGIWVLCSLAAILLLVFGGITDRLIPLFALGAFAAFTLSQLGMVFHWRRSNAPHARRSMFINALGAAATAATLVVLAVSKFTEGAWLVFLAIPPLLYLFEHIHRYHSRVEEQTEDCGPLDVSNLLDPIIVLPLKRLDRIARKALRLALSLTSEIHVIQVLSEDLRTDDLARRWPELVEQPVRRLNRPSPVLIVRPSAYRDFFGPLLDYIREVSQKHPNRHIAILVPEFVERRWYHFIFRHRATLLKILLMLRGGPQVVIITAPWYERSALKEQPFA